MEQNDTKIKISVRNLVEFILRSGDLDNRQGGRRDSVDAMQQGSRIHKKIQRGMGAAYRAEVPLTITVPRELDGTAFEICVEGRADGIFTDEGGNTVIDEIKGVYRDLASIEEVVQVHRAQAMSYAYMYECECRSRSAESSFIPSDELCIRITYCNIETEGVKYFPETFSFDELEQWFNSLIDEYCKWAAWQYHWREQRNASIKQLQFPFPYRPGQRDLVAGVYRTIQRKKKLFIEAPTGVGKTISTVFPAVKSMGEGLTEKIFYTTAKTITRTVAEESFRIMKEQGLLFKLVTLTAKEKICVLEKPDCNPLACERAKGHYDRVNEAVFDMLMHETEISRELIAQYAQKHCVCPFEMCLDVTLWADGIICDYNYVFDPNVYLRRFFANEKPQDYVFLADEAHNLVDRAREMYSAELVKQDFLDVKRLVRDRNRKFVRAIDACNAEMLRIKRECDDCEVLADIDGLALKLMRMMTEFDEFLQERMDPAEKETIFKLYLDVRHFLHMYELLDENYLIFADYNEQEEFRIRLMCMDPSENLKNCFAKGRSAVMFSATLLPIRYYREQLGGTEDDYAVYAPSPFDTGNRLLMIGRDVSTKYTRRGENEYRRIADYIKAFTGAKKGNYFVFFPSYQMMNAVAELVEGEIPGLVMQSSNMTEREKEEFLEAFAAENDETLVGFCVLGGIFSEGIDLKNDRLIGAVVVGTGLPMVCNERELFRGFFDERNNHGFDYAYLYNGMNKVQQAAGRVIRTMEDRGAILLLDERFLQRQYTDLFPREWYPHEVVDLKRMQELLQAFWNEGNKGK